MKTCAAVATSASPYRFVILATMWASYLIVYLSRLSVGPLSPFLKDSFHLSNTQVGMLMSVTAITYAPAMIVAGMMVDRLGVRRVLVSGALLGGICVGLIFVAPSYTAVLLLLALSGLGCGCIYPCAVKALVAWFSKGERATAIGVNQTAINVSGILGAAVLPVVALSLGWQYGFLLVGLLAVSVAVVCYVLYREPPSQPLSPPVADQRDARRVVSVPRGSPSCHRGWAAVRELLLMRDIWLLACGGLLMGVVEFSALAHMVLFFKDGLGYAAVAAGGMLAFCEAGGAIGKPSVGLASDRLLGGRRRPLLVLLAIAACVICGVLAFFGQGVDWVVYPCLVVFGFAAVGWGGLYGTLAGEIGGVERAGLAAGLCSAVTNVGIIIGPPLFGYLVDLSNSYHPSWTLLAIASALAAASWSLIREPQKNLAAVKSDLPVPQGSLEAS